MRSNILTFILVSGLSICGLSSNVMAQETTSTGSNFIGKLFSKDKSSDSSGAKPLFIKPSVSSNNARAKNNSASKTGVAVSSGGSRNSKSPIGYRTVSTGNQDDVPMQELLRQSTEQQNADTNAYRARKMEEAEQMAEIYRQQMRERLAAQQNDPSALQAMGSGGTGGVSDAQVRRKMVYQPDKNATGGKKPIRLFDVR